MHEVLLKSQKINKQLDELAHSFWGLDTSDAEKQRFIKAIGEIGLLHGEILIREMESIAILQHPSNPARPLDNPS